MDGGCYRQMAGRPTNRNLAETFAGYRLQGFFLKLFYPVVKWSVESCSLRQSLPCLLPMTANDYRACAFADVCFFSSGKLTDFRPYLKYGIPRMDTFIPALPEVITVTSERVEMDSIIGKLAIDVLFS